MLKIAEQLIHEVFQKVFMQKWSIRYSLFFLLLVLCSYPRLGHALTDEIYFDEACRPMTTSEKIANFFTHCLGKGHQITLGPEFYYVCQKREGGMRQKGWLYGGKFNYDRIYPCTFYWGFEVAAARGSIKGKTGSSRDVKSRYINFDFEGRVGYNFNLRICPSFVFTPFFSFGYLSECTDFQHPSPLTIHFRTHGGFVGAGFLSTLSVDDGIDLGLNAKFRYLVNPEVSITHDRLNKDSTLEINNAFQYRVELPYTYWFCAEAEAVRVIPFFEHRHYAGRQAFPFNIQETNLNFYGVTLEYLFMF